MTHRVPDWSKAPKWAKYAARDGSGNRQTWFWYENRPQPLTTLWWVTAGKFSPIARTELAIMPGKAPRWEQSRMENPLCVAREPRTDQPNSAPTWAHAPEWAQFAVREASSRWYWYELRPHYDPIRPNYGWMRSAEGGEWGPVDEAHLFVTDGEPPRWQDSMRARPEPAPETHPAPDWSKAPAWATHAMLSASGCWHWADGKPELINDRWIGTMNMLYTEQHIRAAGAAPEWQHSLQARPAQEFVVNQEVTVTHAASILNAAQQHMLDRAATYDKPEGERSMAKTVEAFATITGIDISEEQGWLFMALLKAVRSQQGALRLDSYEDGAAYFALAGEAASKSRA